MGISPEWECRSDQAFADYAVAQFQAAAASEECKADQAFADFAVAQFQAAAASE